MKLDIFKMSIYENLKIVFSKSQIWHNRREYPWNLVELFDFFSFSQKIDCCRHCWCKHTKAYKACTMNMAYTVLSIYVNKILGFLHSNFTRIHYYCVHSTHGSLTLLSKYCQTTDIVGAIILCSQIWVWRVIW